MAEAVVGSLLLKIGSGLVIEPVKSTCSFLTSEASAMHNFFDEMEDIKAELEGIRGFLHEAERFSETAANIKNFIREIRTVAFDIEDIVDEFTYKLNEQNRGVVAKTIKRVTHVKTWYKLTKMLRKRKSQLGEIQKRKNEYDTSGIVKRGETQGGRWIIAEDEHFKKEGDLVGIDENKKKLMDMLSDDGSKHNLISVWGMGGVGKTTLVTHVYNTIKRSFGGFAWITVSQTWERDELLRKILRELHREDPNGINVAGIDTKDFRSLVSVITNYLHNKRYLLILDDVWNPDLWHFIRDKLPEGNTARIILTTRNREVALLAPEEQIMEIIPLEEQHSWDLFCKTAFKKFNTNTCPEELTMWARKIVESCGGLPLAILAIGGVMACKEQTEREWKRMWEDLEHELEHNPNIEYVKRILQLSFADLSCNLKNCLLYCGSFPEDHEIGAVYLTNRWIAEGFVETSRRRTQEEVAEDYLNELVNRCLLHVVKREILRMHDIIHSMVVSKSKEEEFCVVHGTLISSPTGRVRRVSIQNCNLEYARNNEYSLRSISTFNSKISLDSLCSLLRSSKLLRVLDLSGTSLEKLPEEVFHLFNLHYLGLSDNGIKELPKSIGRLQNLQYLYALGTKIIELPSELTKLRGLRVLLVTSGIPRVEDGNYFYNGIMPPREICQLKNLQSVGVIKATDEMIRNMVTLTKLTRLFITEIRSEHCDDLFTAISKVSHLERLSVMTKDGEVLQLQALNTSASLIMISGQLERVSVSQFSRSLQHHNRIRKLELYNCRLDENSFSCLQEIRSMRILCLTDYEGNELCFKEMSFLVLQELKVKVAPHLQRIEIKKGAMPNLEKLYISDCPGPKELPRGVEYLSKLELFEWGNPGGTLVERVQRERTEVNEDRMRILRLIKFTYAANLQG